MTRKPFPDALYYDTKRDPEGIMRQGDSEEGGWTARLKGEADTTQQLARAVHAVLTKGTPDQKRHLVQILCCDYQEDDLESPKWKSVVADAIGVNADELEAILATEKGLLDAWAETAKKFVDVAFGKAISKLPNRSELNDIYLEPDLNNPEHVNTLCTHMSKGIGSMIDIGPKH